MSAANGHLQPRRTSSGEDPIEVGRYMEALRRNRWLIAAIVVIVTAVTLAASLSLPKVYDSSATIIVNNTAGTLGSESQAIQRNLQTTATLVTTAAVLQEAAKSLPGETRTSLAGKVSASVEENANIINIKVTYGTAEGAAKLAGAVAEAFLHQHADLEHSQAASALAALNAQISTLRARSTSEPSVATQLGALQARASELEATSAGTDSQLQLSQQPPVPSSAASPRPSRNVVIALFASIFLAVLVALGREQLTPRVSSQRELGHLLGLPVLSGVPLVGRRVNARYARAEYEAYQSLSAAIRLALPPGPAPHVMLVTGATHGEGKTTVTTRLGRMLAQAGHRTLLVSADLRWPKLDGAFNVEGQPGVRELLALAPDSDSFSPEQVERLIQSTGSDKGHATRGELDILPAGRDGDDASELLHTSALQVLIETLRASDYAYILIDAPPVLGVADSQMLAQFCDEVLLVARLDRLKISDVIDLREMLDRMNTNPVGVVVIGTRPSGSPYYWDTSPQTAPTLSS
jgi:capsular exopolysaccharide synthesis family protein